MNTSINSQKAGDSQKVAYDKKTLKEFEILITRKLSETESEYKKIAGQLRDLQDDATFDTVKEDISDNLIFDDLKMLAVRLEQYMNNLSYALMRIDNGTYGICRSTGKLIPIERLKAVPIATTCVDAKRVA